MTRALPYALLLALSGAVSAAECHYFWTTDCFDIRDAASRDITHHVLLSEQRFSLNVDDTGQCPAAIERLAEPDHLGKVLKRFNKRLKKLRGCQRVPQLTPTWFPTAEKANEEWQRLAREQDFKTLHLIRRLPTPE